MSTAAKETTKVKGSTEQAKVFSGLVKENYLNGLEFTFSLFEQNVKAFNTQADKILDLEREYVSNLGGLYKDFPKELPFVNDNVKKATDQIDSYLALRKDQVQASINITDKTTKDIRTLTQGNVEKAFTLVGDYLNLFKV